jgi:hypothetical protein
MAEVDCSRNIVRKPLYRMGSGITGRQSPAMTFMSNELVPGCNIYLELGWIRNTPEPNPYMFSHTHPQDMVIMYIGNTPEDPEYLGAEIEYYIGGQPLTFNTTAAILVPGGVSHGPVIWKNFEKPHLELVLVKDGGSTRECWESAKEKSAPRKNDDTDYERFLVRKPIYRHDIQVNPGALGPILLYMSNDHVADANIYIDFNWVFGMPDPYISDHFHNFDEVVLHYGNDPDNPEDLGADIEFTVNGQPLLFNTTTALYIPKGVKHGPLLWKSFRKTHNQLPIIIGAGTHAEAAPAGYGGE